MTQNPAIRLKAEWEPQDCVLVTFPHKDTDWHPMLDEVCDCYRNLITAISKYEAVIVLSADKHLAEKYLKGLKNVIIIECPSNDTWTRDHGLITCSRGSESMFLDFQFNGWGLKFPSNHDNQINRHLFEKNILKGNYVNHLDFVLEGGSIESDGKGTILTTSQCLFAPNRNQISDKKGFEKKFHEFFNAKRVLWLDHGMLAGDDTDGHIDTLARICPNDTIVYVECTDSEDEHYEALSLMKGELSHFLTPENKSYKLVGLPLPSPIYYDDVRLPATYANFLIINKAVIVPTYNQPSNDNAAISILSKVFPDREIIGIDSNILIRQHGSIHCCTMQIPSCSLQNL